jgi:outer membrane receptor protein involved in Fe transport
MKLHLLFSALFLVFTSSFFAQKAEITGLITDEKGDPFPTVQLFLDDSKIPVRSDFDGKYFLRNIEPGTHRLTIKSPEYRTKEINDIKLTKNQQLVLNFQMETLVEQITEFTVVGKTDKGGTATLEREKQNSTTVSDGTSSEEMKKRPDTKASDALKRISGASVQDNKFVVIRGLNDRYNAAYLNGAPLPSSESDRKAFSFDIFPVNMLDNMLVTKTASPELPGEFAGGIIQIKTKDIPEKNFQSISFGGGYNTITTFKDQTTYQGGKLDWLGIDDGNRKIPSEIPSHANFPSLMSDQASLAQTFQTDWSTKSKLFAPNFNLQYAGGLNTKIRSKEVGLIGSLSYNKTENFNKTIRRSYTDNTAGGAGASQMENDLLDRTNSTQVLAGAMLNLAIKLNNLNTLSFKNLYSINSDDRLIARTGEINPLDINPTLIRSNARWFSSNSIYSGQLTGDHATKNNRFKFDWVLGYSNIKRTIPNLRRSIYTRMKYVNDPSDPNPNDTIYTANIAPSNVGPDYGGSMFFSENKEQIYSSKASLTYKLDTLNFISTDIKIGGLFQYRNRAFAARQLGYTTYGIPGGNVHFDQNLLYLNENEIFASQNMGLIAPGVGGFKLTDGTKPSDLYNANSTTTAGFISIDNRYKEKIKLNWGVRTELFTQHLDALKANKEKLEINTTKLDFLPSANFIYSPTKKQNIRLSASQTLNRPEYRELAPFAFYDFTTQFVLSGNDSLKRARISNFDARYEYYPGKGQLLSGSLFYKNFENPIEQIARPDVANEISYKNVPHATNYGFEIEFRSVIGSLFDSDSSSFLNNLTLFSNLSIIRSVVDVSQNIGTPYASRPLQGQSPYVFNGGLFYQDKQHDISYAININKVGPRIYILGSVLQPDIWEKSRTFLDVQIAKTFCKKKMEIKLNIQNILAQNLIFYQNNYATTNSVNRTQKALNGLFLGDKENSNGYDASKDDLVWSTNFGQTISFSFSYKF